MKTLRVFALTSYVLALTWNASGQIGTTIVLGRIQDPTGAVVANAAVQMKHTSTNQVFRTVTTNTGDYTLSRLPVGAYDIEASSAGFKTEVLRGVTLEIGRTYRFDFQFTVGETTQRMEVQGEASLLRTETADFGQVIGGDKIAGLPMNSRDLINTLGALTPGLSPSRRGIGRSESFNAGSNINVRGNRNGDNLVLLDSGIFSFGNSQLTVLISPDAIQEFEVKTGLYSAEYGIKPGGQFSMITKSGGNDLHMTLFEYLRNNNLDARNFFDPGPRPQFKRNQFGAVFSGPVFIPTLFNGKDKVWFLFSYAGERVRRLVSLTGSAPTANEKAGLFASTINDPTTGQPFPNNTIPASRINPISQKFIPFWPDPNTTGRGFNYTSPTSSSVVDSDQYIAKIDLKTTDTNRWSGRFLYHAAPINNLNAIQTFASTDRYFTLTQNVTNTRTFHARYLNEFSANFGFSEQRTVRAPNRPGFGTEFGVPGFPVQEIDFGGVPSLSVTGLLSVGDNSSFGPFNEFQWEARDTFSFNQGAHSFKAGYHFRRYAALVALQSRSAFTFNPRYSGNAFGDFLLGSPTGSSLGNETFRENYGQNGHFFFLQDTWRATSRLTIDIGLRFEYRAPGKDKRGFATNFNPATGLLDPPLQALTLQPWQTGRYVADVPLITWEKVAMTPRLGIAYRLTNKTVIRTGFGVFANEPSVAYTQSLGQNVRPNAAGVSFTGDLRTPTISMSNPFNPSAQVPGGGLPNVFSIQRPLPNMLNYSWGFSIQQQIAANTALEIGYQGAHTVHDYQVTEFNDAVPGSTPRQQRRPYPQYQTVRLTTANGSSQYNGLEAKIDRRAGKSGLSGLLAFTWAKQIDTVGGRLSVPGDPATISRNMSLRQNRGIGEGNIPARLVLMTGYETPFGQGKPYLTSGAAGKILGGWSLYSILTLQKGPWTTAIYNLDRLDVGSTATSRPDALRNPNLDSSRTPQRWFDTTAFAAPLPFTYGNAGRGIIEGPGYINLDFSVMRSFKPVERLTLQFRFDAYNGTNHTNFLLPTLNFGTSTFGVIGSSVESRDLQFGLKFLF